jgi:hypothetical protein
VENVGSQFLSLRQFLQEPVSLRRVAAFMTPTALSKVVRSEIQKRAALVKVRRLKPD